MRVTQLPQRLLHSEAPQNLLELHSKSKIENKSRTLLTYHLFQHNLSGVPMGIICPAVKKKKKFCVGYADYDKGTLWQDTKPQNFKLY